MPPKPITIEYLDSALKELRDSLHTNIVNELTQQIQQLRSIIDKQNDTISLQSTQIENFKQQLSSQHNAIIHQAKRIEAMEVKNRSLNLIIRGIPENPTVPLIDDIQNNFKSNEPFNIVSCSRIGKLQQNNTRPIKITVSSFDDKIKLSNFARSNLRTKSIYVNFDEPPLTSRENKRLRDKAKSLKTDNPTKDYKLDKGRLLVDGMELDRFDLKNQIF